jgi:hypothetical protein
MASVGGGAAGAGWGGSVVWRCRSPQMRPTYSGRPSLVSQSAISCIAAHARLYFGLLDPLDGRFYPIDRAARNRPKTVRRRGDGRASPKSHRRSLPRVRPGRRLKVRDARFGLFRSYKPFPCIMLATEGQNMATSAERMRALRERQRRGLRKLRIQVSEDDLRAIAKRGYEGAVTSDLDQQA